MNNLNNFNENANFNQKNFSPTALILLAGGSGSRMKCPVKKQHLRIKNKALWQLVLGKFQNTAKFHGIKFCQEIIAADEPVMMSKMQPDVKFVLGGDERAKSIQNALKCLLNSLIPELKDDEISQIFIAQGAEKSTIVYNLFKNYPQLEKIRVLISDVARCFCSKNLIHKMLLADSADCCYAAISCADTARYVNFTNQQNIGEICEQKLLKREHIELVQTPQNSSLKALLNADLLGFSDESSAIAAAGGSILAITGEASNKKLTHPQDLLSLRKGPSDGLLATGSGFDLHEFCSSEIGSPTTEQNRNERLILGGADCGEMALKAHSDGDVLTHAIIDALLGAACLGDIGEIFPDSDAKWRKVRSLELLRAVVARLASVGLAPAHISAQVLAQTPKILPFKRQIERNLSAVCGCSVNVAASTTEGLGPIGQRAAIAAIATANLRAYDWRAHC